MIQKQEKTEESKGLGQQPLDEQISASSQKRKYPRLSPEVLGVIIAIALATGIRVAVISLGWQTTNSDEDTMGLMALHIAYRGELPSFFTARITWARLKHILERCCFISWDLPCSRCALAWYSCLTCSYWSCTCWHVSSIQKGWRSPLSSCYVLAQPRTSPGRSRPLAELLKLFSSAPLCSYSHPGSCFRIAIMPWLLTGNAAMPPTRAWAWPWAWAYGAICWSYLSSSSLCCCSYCFAAANCAHAPSWLYSSLGSSWDSCR